MVRVKVAIGLLVASLILLIIYGADAAVASSSPEGRGFIPLSEAVRGSGLGGGAFVMSIIAFVISWKRLSSMVAILLFVNGGLIIAGMLALIAQGALASENAEGAMRTISSTLALGAILVALGAWKTVGDRRKVGKEQPSR
jgi:hypothetical protein